MSKQWSDREWKIQNDEKRLIYQILRINADYIIQNDENMFFIKSNIKGNIHSISILALYFCNKTSFI